MQQINNKKKNFNKNNYAIIMHIMLLKNPSVPNENRNVMDHDNYLFHDADQ